MKYLNTLGVLPTIYWNDFSLLFLNLLKINILKNWLKNKFFIEKIIFV